MLTVCQVSRARGWSGMFLYDAYQAQQDALSPLRAAAGLARACLLDTSMGPAANYLARCAGAAAEIVARSHMIHTRPDYDIKEVPVEGRPVPVIEEDALEMPFANLVHFRKETNIPQPRVLLVAPMAGHFPTLLRQTAETLLRDHDVYITDWKSGARSAAGGGALRHRRICRLPDQVLREDRPRRPCRGGVPALRRPDRGGIGDGGGGP